MPNEVTSLLNALNSYITCPLCKATNEIEIILTCGHLICKNCKAKRTKCPVCYSELSATRLHAPSIKFIKELCGELSKTSTVVHSASTKFCNSLSLEKSELFSTVRQTSSSSPLNKGYSSPQSEIIHVESELEIGNSIITPNVKSEQNTRNGFGTNDNKEIKKKNNFGLKEDVEISNDKVKIINELNKYRNKDNNRKNSSRKKKFYKNKEERKVYRNILKGLGIVGIDKQIKKVKSEHALNAREKELNGQLNTIISRLNYHYPKNDNVENTKFYNSSKMITDSDSSDSDHNCKMNYKTAMTLSEAKDGLHVIKCDLKRNGFNHIKTCSGLKRKNVESGTEEGPCRKAFMKNIDAVDDNMDFGTGNQVSPDKKLGGIVDETEIIQRYLNLPKKSTGNKEIKNQIKSCNDVCTEHKSFLPKKPVVANIVSPAINKTTNYDNKHKFLSKSEVKNIISGVIEEIGTNSEDDVLQSDIMVDMLHNVSNEIVVVGNNLCSAEKNTEFSNSSVHFSNNISSLKNYSVDNSPCKQKDDKKHSVSFLIKDIKNETESNSGEGGVIVVSDSEDDVEIVEKYSISDSSQTKNDQSDIHLEKDINVMNCRIVLNDLPPLMFQSAGNDKHNGEHSEVSNMKKCLTNDITANIEKTDLKKKNPKKVKMNIDDQKINSGNNNLNLISTLPKVSSRKKKGRCDEVLNNFEGFTEDDILILTVKLALFKMNCSKYSKNLPSTSLYCLDGKQILIKDMSQEECYPDSPCCPNKISNLTIEIADSEDESSKSLVTSGVQTENELLTYTPSPSTSKIRPVSLVKLRGFEIENEKFMQNDVLDIGNPLTPNTPLGKESLVSSISQNSPVLRTTPVSRRQLSFIMSPPFGNNLQPLVKDTFWRSDNRKLCFSIYQRFFMNHFLSLIIYYRYPNLRKTSKYSNQDDGASTSDLKAIESVSNSSFNDHWQVLHNRMQHMIPSNPEDALHSEFEHSGVNPTRLTFTTCGLNSKETALVTKLAQMTKSCLTKDFTHNTTHLVIGATGRGRLEYYLAIAYRAFIVTMDWVTLCLALNKILPVTGFIPTEDEGPLKCLEPNSLPFAGFHVFSKISATSSNYPIAEITKTLLSLGGARVLPNLDAFHALQDGNYPRFFIYNCKSVLTQPVLDKCASLHILPIQFMWVYESIGAFRAIPVMDFLDIGVHSRTLIRDYKIPDQLACSRYPRLEAEFHPQVLDERYQRSL